MSEPGKSVVVWTANDSYINSLGNMHGLYGGPIDPIVQQQMNMLNGYYRQQQAIMTQNCKLKRALWIATVGGTICWLLNLVTS